MVLHVDSFSARIRGSSQNSRTPSPLPPVLPSDSPSGVGNRLGFSCTSSTKHVLVTMNRFPPSPGGVPSPPMGQGAKGVCPRCGTPVLGDQPRERTPDGVYWHQKNPDGSCRFSHGGRPPMGGPMSPPRPSLNDSGYINYVPPPGVNPVPQAPYGALQESRDGGSTPALVKGICRKCRTPVSNTQARTRLYDGTYAHQVGPDGLCIGVYSGLPKNFPPPHIDQTKAFAC
eukprot:3055899-Rhodomonas_salina.1